MNTTHFLAHINDERWLAVAETQILLSFGPQSRALLLERAEAAQLMPQGWGLTLDETTLPDFTVQEVYFGILAEDETVDFKEEIAASDDPQRVSGALLPNVLECRYWCERIRLSRVVLTGQGTLEISVYHPGLFDGRPFQLDGSLRVSELAPRARQPRPFRLRVLA